MEGQKELSGKKVLVRGCYLLIQFCSRPKIIESGLCTVLKVVTMSGTRRQGNTVPWARICSSLWCYICTVWLCQVESKPKINDWQRENMLKKFFKS